MNFEPTNKKPKSPGWYLIRTCSGEYYTTRYYKMGGWAYLSPNAAGWWLIEPDQGVLPI